MGSFNILRFQPRCELLNNRNEMMFFVWIFDLFLLVILPVLNIIFCILLILTCKRINISSDGFGKPKSTLKSKENITKSSIIKLNDVSSYRKSSQFTKYSLTETDYFKSSKSLDNKLGSSVLSIKLEKCISNVKITRNRYLMLKCIIYSTIFGVFFSIPSMFLRNIVMILITVMSLNESTDSKSNQSSYFSLYNNASGADLNYLNDTLLNTQTEINNQYNLNSIVTILTSTCGYTDYLLLIASSHKFFIFLYQLSLVKLPKYSLYRKRTSKQSLKE